MASWEIFCSVVDNYGDIGVTWRLARQLAAEHGLEVRLWVDDLAAFARICPQADPLAAVQQQMGVEVRLWPADWQAVTPADVVIEAFACELPAAHVAAMAAREQPPLWINLEYLSAEDWVEGCHGLPSLHASGLRKFFWFPGFTPATGGLLREAQLLAQRDAWQADAAARRAFLAGLGVDWQGERLISLFAYEQPQIASWLDQLAGGEPTLLLVPEGRVLGDVARWAGQDLVVGDGVQRGNLRLQVLPFVSQQDYDRLLWSCDLNAVRGEDSFVRALWAGRPLLWHIYVQEEGVHLDKLDSFLDRWLQGCEPALAEALRRCWHQWNGDGAGMDGWAALQALWPQWQACCLRQTGGLARQRDLAAGLVQCSAACVE